MTFRVTWNGGKISREVGEAGARALYLGAEHILEESTRIVPLKEGILMASGEVTMSCNGASVKADKDGNLQRSGTPGYSGGDLEAAVSYDTPYALAVHEGEKFNFGQGRQAKYLEGPMKERARAVQEFIRREIGKAFK